MARSPSMTRARSSRLRAALKSLDDAQQMLGVQAGLDALGQLDLVGGGEQRDLADLVQVDAHQVGRRGDLVQVRGCALERLRLNGGGVDGRGVDGRSVDGRGIGRWRVGRCRVDRCGLDLGCLDSRNDLLRLGVDGWLRCGRAGAAMRPCGRAGRVRRGPRAARTRRTGSSATRSSSHGVQPTLPSTCGTLYRLVRSAPAPRFIDSFNASSRVRCSRLAGAGTPRGRPAQAGHRRGRSSPQMSSRTVTGPSLMSATCISAPNTPLRTVIPRSSSSAASVSRSGCASSRGAAAAQDGRRPLLVSA